MINACARLVDALLTACPHLMILATSREALGIGGEQVWRVPTLAVPTREAFSLAARALEYEAVRLFVERARAVRGDFALTDENALAVAEICARLDGIPLALELAAARVTLLSPAQIAARLDDRFNLLTSGSRTALPRQQTLRALMDWSYELLTRAEQILLQRLAVFDGGGTLEAIEQVCNDAALPRAQILDLLGALVNKSLVVAQAQGAATRYQMLETLREYTREKLAASGDSDTRRDQHLAYWLALANDSNVDEELTPEGHARLEHEGENLFAALHWALNNSVWLATRARQGIRLTALLAVLWQKGNNAQEPYRWLQRALAVADALGDTDSETRAALLFHAGAYARFDDDLPTAIALLSQAIALAHFPHDASALLHLSRVYTEQQANDAAARAANDALALYRAHTHALGQARARAQLGSVAIDNGDWRTAQEHLREAITLSRAINQPRLLLISLREQSNLAFLRGDLDAAEKYAQEMLAVNATHQNDWFQAAAFFWLGRIATKRRRWEQARAYLTQMLELWDRVGKRSFVGLRLLALANIEVATGQWERAATLWGAADALIQETGIVVIPTEQQEFDASIAILRAQLDESTRVRAYAQARAMPYAQIVQFAIHPT